MNNEDVSRRSIALTMKAGKLTAWGQAHVLQAAGRKIRKAHRGDQAFHGRKSVKQLMGHGAATSSIKVDAPRLFDRMARKWNVDYAFYQTGPEKYLLFFKSAQADAITACFSEYSKLVFKRERSRPAPIQEQVKQAAEQVKQPPQRERERVKEAAHEDR